MIDPVTVSGYLLAAVAAFVAWRTKVGDVWKGEAEAYKAKAERLESEVADLRSEFTAYKTDTDQRMGRLEIANTTLAELASGRPAVAELADRIDLYHAVVLKAIEGTSVPV